MTGLANQGWKFSVVSFEKEMKDIDLHENISWHPLQYHKSPPILSSLYDIGRLHIKAKSLARENSIGIVHCRGYITSLAGLHLKIKYGLKFIFDMRGFWVDEKLESGNWSSPIFRPVYNYFKKKEKQFITNADRIISLTHAGKNYLISTFSVEPDRIQIIPTCVDFSQFQRTSISERNLLREELGIQKDAYVFLYSGSLGGNYPVELLMQYYKKISKGYENARLLVVCKQPDLLKEYPEVVTKSANRKEMPGYLSAGDAGIIFYKTGFSNIGRCPTKYAEYVGCGLKVHYLESYGDLSTYTPEMAEEYFDLNKGVKKYDKVYKEIAKGLSARNLHYSDSGDG